MSADEKVKYMGCKPVEAWKCEMELVECLGCGFHLGVDATYLLQVDSVTTRCPSCDKAMIVFGEDLDDEEGSEA